MKQIVLLALLVCPVLARAQQSDTAAPEHTAADSAFLRARQLVVGGNGDAGRALVDSLLAAARPGTPAYAQALYWRASLASSAAAAERDYQRIIVEYPFSPRAADALYALAQLESSRGDRAGAAGHLQRLLLEHPEFPEHARAALTLGRLLLDMGQLPKGCAVLLRTRAGVPASNVELLNQIDYYAARCEGVDTATVAAAPTKRSARTTTAAESTWARSPRADSSRRARTPTDSQARRADSAAPTRSAPAKHDTHETHAVTRYAVQVAAYDSRPSAEHLVARLKARGIEARVVGTSKPFRVRVGHYASRSEAVAEEKRLKARGIAGFVATETEAR